MPLLHVVNRKVNGPRHAGDQRRHILPTVEDADVETAGDDVELATSSVLSGVGDVVLDTRLGRRGGGRASSPNVGAGGGGATSGSSASAALVDPGRGVGRHESSNRGIVQCVCQGAQGSDERVVAARGDSHCSEESSESYQRSNQ